MVPVDARPQREQVSCMGDQMEFAFADDAAEAIRELSRPRE
jgi:hypothetical protein